MHADYDNDTCNHSIEVHEEHVCADVDNTTRVQNAVVMRQESTAQKQKSAENIVQPCSENSLHEAQGIAVKSNSCAGKKTAEHDLLQLLPLHTHSRSPENHLYTC